MSLDVALKRLSLRPTGVCHQCRRAFASSTARRQQQSATGGLTETFTSARNQPSSQPVVRPESQTPAQPPPESTTASRPGDPAAVQRTSFEVAKGAIQDASAASIRRQEEQRRRALNIQYNSQDYESQNTRRWRAGDVYAPHDLSGVEMAKWKKNRRKGRTNWDVMDQLGMNPIDHYKNFSIMSEYMTDMGRIKHRNETGLRPVNQRRMAKAIRRAVGMGLMPDVHRHPEIIKWEMSLRQQQQQRQNNR